MINHFLQSPHQSPARHSVLHSRVRKRAEQVESFRPSGGKPQPRQAEAVERTVHTAAALQNTSGEARKLLITKLGHTF